MLAALLAGPAACRRQPEPAMDADQVLRRMSDVLAGAPRLSFSARREADPDLQQRRDLPAQTVISVRLVRPQRIAVTLDGGSDRRAMYSDGRAFTIQDVTKRVYSTVPLQSTLGIRARVSAVTYLGEAPDASGTRCHRLAAAGEVADAELWVGAADFLPRQLVATSPAPGASRPSASAAPASARYSCRLQA
jgi:hypothetical protein